MASRKKTSAPSAAAPTGPPPAARGRRSPSPEDDALQVLRQFRQVFNAVKGHFRQLEKAAGLGGAQVWALSIVRDRPGLGVSELARTMDIHQSTASNLVRALVERGLVAAAKEQADKRTVQLRLLPAGARLLRTAPAPHTGLLPAALRALDPQTLARLKRDLAQLIVALGADARGARIPLGD